MNPLLLKVLPYIGALGIAAGAWFYHDWVTDGLKDQISEAKETATGLQTAMDAQTISYADATIAAKTRYNTALEKTLATETRKYKARAAANLRLASEAKRAAEVARVNLLAFEQEFAQHREVCGVTERAVCLLAAASGAEGADGDSCPRVPSTAPPSATTGQIDDAPEASVGPSAVPPD